MSEPDKSKHVSPAERKWNYLGLVTGGLMGAGVAFIVFPESGAGELLAIAVLIALEVGAMAGVLVSVLVNYLIRKRRPATSVLLKPPQDEIEFWKEADRRYEEAKARLLERQKDRSEDS